ncbi:MAG: polysaccharide pyruvyl transferase family protein [Lewinella sp.]|nr:polysaccharide pyruvyl transferase family protein [Lewinella sp.]
MLKAHLKKQLALAVDMARSWKQHFIDPLLPARALPKPQVINLLANDICNSKCTMCNIWQQKQDVELSPEELYRILTNELFTEVTAVGITGGEPTMREDLPALYDACCRALPKLRGMSIITNAIKQKDVIARITAVAEVLQRHGKSFSIMVSLDGVGEVHDQQRGRPGNFESAMSVINHFRHHTDIPVSIGCTITKQNVWQVDGMLDFLQAEGLYGRFRVAEFIKRLYNDDRTEDIRNFTAEERYHLACFFQRLIQEYETELLYKRTYQSIISLLTGGQRTIGCPYHEKGVVLDSRGTLLYCAPKSAELGSALEGDAMAIFRDNLAERDRIRREHCEDCIHDYHAPATWPEYRRLIDRNLWRLALEHQPWPTHRLPLPGRRRSLRPPGTTKQVFITGWYGTETVGDKAILAAIMQHYRSEFAGEQLHLIISAIYPFVTERTLVELGMEATVIPTYSRDFQTAARESDIVVMGGGPLMEMPALGIPLAAFRYAKQAGKRTVIFGCGLGPLPGQRSLRMAREILRLADEISLRDRPSIEWARALTGREDIRYSGDPAAAYVRSLRPANPPDRQAVLACYLREWSPEYQGEMTDEEFDRTRREFEQKLARAIRTFCEDFQLTPHFYCMHTFTVGGDDRRFYRRFLDEHFAGTDYYLEAHPSSVDQIVGAMTTASYNLCMRFHSVLFAHTLGANFFAIDYTGGGKIKGFLQDHQSLHRMVDLRAVAAADDFSFQQMLEDV